MFQKENQKDLEGESSQLLEKRLTAYYGPALPPYPLPETAWLRLRDQLTYARRLPWYRRGPRWAGLLSLRRDQEAPTRLREQLAALLVQVNYRGSSPDLRCHFSARPIQPRVQVLPPGRVRLFLPEQNWYILQTVELEVLLACGLARTLGLSRAPFLLVRLLFALGCLLVVAALPFTSVDRRALWMLGLAVICCVAGACLVFWQGRALAFRGDCQAVQWLGRERICRGLHLLAERGQPRRRPAWGEPSLAERIARVCGSPVRAKDEHLTLVG